MRPDDYLAITREEYERRLVEGLWEQGLLLRQGFSIDRVEIKGDFPKTAVALLLRSSSRPGCIFGFEARIWQETGDPWPVPDFGYEPGDYAYILFIHLGELLASGPDWLPVDCEGGPVWIHQPAWTYWGDESKDDRGKFKPPEPGEMVVLAHGGDRAVVLEVMDDGHLLVDVWRRQSHTAETKVVPDSEVLCGAGRLESHLQAGEAADPDRQAFLAWARRDRRF